MFSLMYLVDVAFLSLLPHQCSNKLSYFVSTAYPLCQPAHHSIASLYSKQQKLTEEECYHDTVVYVPSCNLNI